MNQRRNAGHGDGEGGALATVMGEGEALVTVMEKPAEKRWPR